MGLGQAEVLSLSEAKVLDSVNTSLEGSMLPFSSSQSLSSSTFIGFSDLMWSHMG